VIVLVTFQLWFSSTGNGDPSNPLNIPEAAKRKALEEFANVKELFFGLFETITYAWKKRWNEMKMGEEELLKQIVTLFTSFFSHQKNSKNSF